MPSRIFAAGKSFSRGPRFRYKYAMSVSKQKARPNLSLNRSANGVPPGPRGSCGTSSASRPRRHTAVARLALR